MTIVDSAGLQAQSNPGNIEFAGFQTQSNLQELNQRQSRDTVEDIYTQEYETKYVREEGEGGGGKIR